VTTRSLYDRPILCLVTDRRRLAERLAIDPDGEAILERLVAQAAEAAAAGVDWIQVRERDLDTRVLCDLVDRLIDAVSGRARVIVSDRLDVALARGAAGVHLGERSVPADRVRVRAPAGFQIGVSRHEPAALRETGPVDYVIVGTVFASRSKPDAGPLLGLDGLAAACQLSRVPVIAIGGVTVHTLAQVLAAGAAGVAAIDLFLPAAAGAGGAQVHEIVARMHEMFDSSRSVS
jgi:thiamine-phosphate pyrophosphorylase